MKRLITLGLLMTSPVFPPAHAAPAQSEDSIAAETSAPRHAAWTQLLQTYVHTSPDGVNRFDYGALKANSQDRATLDIYIKGVAATDLAALSPPERFAALANLYNALTIRLVVEKYPVDSIKDIRPNLLSIGPWKMDVVLLNGEETSLDDIEHKMLRPEFNDPRVHYAVNCASIGCPNLRSQAWEAATLEADLNAAARDYINHPRGVTVRPDGRLKVSTIYKWYRQDFGGSDAGVIAHIKQYAGPDLVQKLGETPQIAERDYDWSLNDVPATE